MVHRITLIAGVFAATAIMSFAAGTQSTPAPAPTEVVVAAQDVAAAAPVAPTAPAAATAPQTVTDTVYVLPAAEPAVIHVTRQAPAVTPATPARATAAPRHRASQSDDEGGSGESEGEGD